MDIINLIFYHIQNEDYVVNSNVIIDKKLKDIVFEAKNNIIKNEDYIDELIHDSASIGQYEGFKIGMKTMLDIITKINSI